jgi:beta-lactamase regulating signal transducer with metallopeptidase domain
MTLLERFAEDSFLLLLNFTVRATLILVIALCITTVAKGISSAVRYRIWVFSFVGVLLLPLLTWVLPIGTLPIGYSYNVNETSSTVARNKPALQQPENNISPSTDAPDIALPYLDQTVSSAEHGSSDSLEVSWILFGQGFLVSLWGAAVIMKLAHYLQQVHTLVRITRQSKPLLQPEWSAIAPRVAATTRCQRKVRVVISDEVQVPMTWGLHEAIILIPSYGLHWSDTQRNIVLLHEMTHIVRRDYLTGWIAQLCSALLPFNPIMWVALKRAALERECACDEQVVASGIKATEYSRQLIDVAHVALHHLQGAVQMVQPSSLQLRVRRLLNRNHRNQRAERMQRAAATGVIVLGIIALTLRIDIVPSAASGSSSHLNGNPLQGQADPRTAIHDLMQDELLTAIEAYGAAGGTILVMDPRTGEVLAWASAGGDGNTDPAWGTLYEPGTVFGVVTAAAALQSGGITPDFTYMDSYVYEIGGTKIYNWDRAGHGSQRFDAILMYSWNVGTTTLAVDVLGREKFYDGLHAFGVGIRTGINRDGEVARAVSVPGDTYWAESNLAFNSFGQRLYVTPLQMLTFFNAMANEGRIMQPYIADDTAHNPAVLHTPLSPQVAEDMTEILVATVEEGEGRLAGVSGYTIAGKAGTAEIACADIPQSDCTGYHPSLHNNTFAGYFPADSPQVSILVKLDLVNGYGAENAAPTFARVAAGIAHILEIPPQR